MASIRSLSAEQEVLLFIQIGEQALRGGGGVA
jgi:hypothetical protein